MHAIAKPRGRFDSRSHGRSSKDRRRGCQRRLSLESLEPRQMLTATPGTWTPLTNPAPTNIPGTMELLTDGSVMVQGSNASEGWSKLTPDAAGSYVNGTWSALANMSETRVYTADNVLQDGRLMVLGGEYTSPPYTQTDTNTGEIYNPLSNTWSSMASFPESTFGSCASILLADGRVLAGAEYGPETFIYDPASNTWSNGPTKLDNDPSLAEVWTKLPDGSILSYDNWGGGTEAQRLDPTTNTWIDSGTVPVPLQSSTNRGGPAVLLPDGRVFVVGGNSNTAIYTPSTTPGGTGSWQAGPVIPNGLVSQNAAGAMMPNGDVLFAAGSAPGNNTSPIHIFEFDPTAPIDSSLTDVTPAASLASNSQPFVTRMLVLPTGQVLAIVIGSTSQLYVYTPNGSPQAAWQPTITNVSGPDANGNYTLTGTQLNGLSAGGSKSGSEADTNYPIVELNDGAGHVYFARTFNWSSTGVATGSTPVSTEFSLPTNIPYGNYSLTVVADGIASAPVSFTGGYQTDLAVTNTGPATSTEGSNVTFNLSVTDNGPTAATGVLTDTLNPNLKYVSATESQGSIAQSGSTVTFSFGTIAVGQTVTATVTAQALEDGNLNNSASVTSNLPDPNPGNNTTATTVAVSEPAIVVSAPIKVSGKSQSNVTVATFTHANGLEPASAFVATINWGDNSTSTGTITQSGTTYTVKGSHTYSKNGSYTVTTTVVEAGNSPNVAMASPSSTTATPAAATSTVSTSDRASASTAVSSTDPANRHDALFANTSRFADLSAPSIGGSSWAGAQPIADTDNLDAIFELLGGLGSNAFV